MALYHTHRPQTFADLIDQEHIVTTLANQLIHNKTAHAYLFSGPRGVGKTTTARILAKSLNCTDKKEDQADPCNICNSCKEITGGRSIDVIEIDAASHTGVDNVRQNIIDSTQFKPTMSKYKIFIIDEVHMLSTAAFNALLKTLEEPPAYVVFILATTDQQKLPATVISRCQRFTFHKVSDTKMKKHITNIAKKEGITIDDDVLSRIVKKSEGCARDAVSLLDQLMATGDKKITSEVASLILPTTNIELQYDFTELLLKKQQREAIVAITDMVSQGVSLPHFARELIEFLRACMIATIDINLAQKEMDLHDDMFKKMQELIKASSQAEILSLIDMTLRRSAEIKSSPLPQLPLEMLVVEWCTQNQEKNTQQTKPVEQKKIIIAEQRIEQEPKSTNTQKPVEKIVERNQNVDVEINIDTQTEQHVSEANSTKAEITKEQFETSWVQCLKQIEAEAPSLVFILKMAHFVAIKDNIVQFSVEYNFHREKLMEKATREKIESILHNLLGISITLDIITDAPEAQHNIQDQELNNLASMLGGQVI